MEKMLILGSGGFHVLGLFYTVMNWRKTLELIPENENRKLP